ncbi:MAG: PKD domain-containing protein [Candidatus Halalkalibacterium sp. M3_1C_030]
MRSKIMTSPTDSLKTRINFHRFVGTRFIFVLMMILYLSACESLVDSPDCTHSPIQDFAIESEKPGDQQSKNYTITLLPDGVQSSISNNNLTVDDRGNIFGAILENGPGTKRAVKWVADASGSITNPELLGTLPAPYDNAEQTTQDANASNEAAGYAENDTGTRVAWVWSGGSMMLLPAPSFDHQGYGTFGINDAGIVVGQTIENVTADSTVSHGIAWVPPYTDPVLLPRATEYSLNGARSINNNGVITGFLRSPGLADAAVQWKIDTDGNVLSGPNKLDRTEGLLVSNANETLDITGLGTYLAKLYRSDSNQLIDLQMLADDFRSRARDVDERATDGSLRVVGVSDDGTSTSASAILWAVSSDGSVSGPTDIGRLASVTGGPPSQRVSYIAAGSYALNNNGWIVGWTMEDNGTLHGTLWQPNQDDSGGDDTDTPGSGPSASFSYSCDKTDTCLFTDTSTSGDSSIIEWSWESNAGHSADTQNTTFTFGSTGDYTVTLTVADADGLSDSASQTISCSSHPRFGLRCQ